ncbi:MAG: hypothetical protein ACM3Q2_17830 [Syntrophothermus sp.]
MKKGFCAVILLMGTLLRAQQITQDDIRIFLMIQNSNLTGDSLKAQSEMLYGKFMKHISYRFADAAEGALFSVISGISMGANESNVIRNSYGHYSWMPKIFQDWYNMAPRERPGVPDYHPLSWQFFFREIDMAAEIRAYYQWLRFFRNEWYLALLTHWIIKNTFATIIRDLFRYGKPFYSFDISMLLPSGKTYGNR